MKKIITSIIVVLTLASCSTKKEILYLQDSKSYTDTPLNFDETTIQPNDVLRITVSALVQESAEPYNFQVTQQAGNMGGGQNQMLDGYVVTKEYTIKFPILGVISVKGLTPFELEDTLKELLEEGDHLKNPTVNVRIMNSKFTVLGQVNGPGTINYTDINLTILQAIGLAGDLTINGKREDITLIREVDGIRTVTHLDLTSMDITESPFYYIRPNDLIIVNPNGPEVKRAGYLPSLGALLGFASFAITIVLLIQN